MTGWGPNNVDERDAVTVLVACQPNRLPVWSSVLSEDGRFSLQSFTNDAADLQRKLASSPDIVLVDAMIFDSPESLLELLSTVQKSAYVLLPPTVTEEYVEQLRSLKPVKGHWVGDVNLANELPSMYETSLTLRSRAPSVSLRGDGFHRSGISGLRIVSVFGFSGGAGRTTIASSLAFEALKRGFRPLLLSFCAPDDLPIILDLNPEPNIGDWAGDPTPRGLEALIQQKNDLDVIVGFRTSLDESDALDYDPDAEDSIKSLVMKAAFEGYSPIVIDTPASGSFPYAIMASNTMVLVSRPTVAGVSRAARAYQMVVSTLAVKTQIAPSNIFVALNMCTGKRDADYPDNVWHDYFQDGLQAIDPGLRAPPVIASIPEDPVIRVAQNNQKIATQLSNDLSRQIHVMADALFGKPMTEDRKERGKLFKLGGLKFRVKD